MTLSRTKYHPNSYGEELIIICHFRFLVQENVGLKEINLAWNGFEDEGALTLGLALRANGTLEHMDLTCNRITGKGLHALATALSANDSLRTLLMGRNHIGEEAARRALCVLATCSELTLEYLDLAVSCQSF